MSENNPNSIQPPNPKINGSRHDLEIPMLTPDQTRKTAQVVRWQMGDNYIHITCDGRSWQGSGYDALASLMDVRQYFEPEGYRLLCYGASLNGSPSGMSRDSDMVYQLGWGESPKRTRAKSIHNVFNTGPDVIPATYREQQAFKARWQAGEDWTDKELFTIGLNIQFCQSIAEVT